VEEMPVQKPGPGEVSIEVSYCGICGSDLHAFKGEHPFIPLPATPGHEFSGTIAAVGKGVTDLKLGERVVCEPNLVCGKCYNCSIGQYNRCNEVRVMGCQGDGAMSDYFIAPSEKTIRIPDNLSLRNAVLAEPLAVGVHAVRRSGDLFRKNVVIIGAGTIGLMVLTCVKEAGARQSIVTDLSESRLALASQMGATRTINAGTVEIVENILSDQPYEGIDVVFECVGAEKCIRDAIAIARKGGRIIVCGVFGSETKVRMADIQDRELELFGVLMYTRREVTDAIDILAEGRVRTDLFISKEYSLKDSQEAFEAALNTDKNVKVIFKIH
jgi:L-iditol 2-dehydrogenase